MNHHFILITCKECGEQYHRTREYRIEKYCPSCHHKLTTDRKCQGCQRDISHKKLDARVCGDNCYNKVHKTKRNADNRACAARRYLKNRTLLVQYLSEHPCVDCGENDIVVLDFDHLYAKRAQIGDVLGSWKWDSILTEIEKCEVRCANCHRRKTSKQFGWFKSNGMVGDAK